MYWHRLMKESCKELAYVGPSQVPWWGPRNGASRWLETFAVKMRGTSLTHRILRCFFLIVLLSISLHYSC